MGVAYTHAHTHHTHTHTTLAQASRACAVDTFHHISPGLTQMSLRSVPSMRNSFLSAEISLPFSPQLRKIRSEMETHTHPHTHTHTQIVINYLLLLCNYIIIVLSKRRKTVFCISPIYLSRQRTLVLNCLMNHVLEFVVDRKTKHNLRNTPTHTHKHTTHAYNNEIYKVFQTKLLTKQESNPTLYHTHTIYLFI